MSWKTLAICSALTAVAVTGCNNTTTPPPVEEPSTHRYILDAADVPPVSTDDPPTTVGFDLDGVVSDGTGPNCTDEEDFTSSISGSAGVDNQLAANVIPLLMSMPDFADGLGPLLLEQIAQGTFLLVMDVTSNGLDDDDTVSVHLFLAEPPGPACDNDTMTCPTGSICDPDADAANPANCGPVTGSDGHVVEGQVFVSAMDIATVDGEINDGHLEIALPSFPLALTISGMSLTLNLTNAHIEADIDADTLTNGEIGAQLSVAAIVDLAEGLGVSGIDESTIRAVAGPDLDPSADPTVCDAISAGLSFHGVMATPPAP